MSLQLSDIRPYLRRAQYHETDQMGLTHHANYIKWLEEARIDFLEQIGVSYGALEKLGLVSPIVAVSCEYKRMVRFGESVSIAIQVKKYTGVKLVLAYTLANTASNEVCTIAETTSCFMNREGGIISLKKDFPAIHELFSQFA